MAKKQNLSYQDIEASLTVFKENTVSPSDVGYEILKAFGKGEADIRRYREGKGVLARYDGLLIKGLFGYKSADTTALTATLEEMKQDEQVIKAAPKIVAVSDGETILAYDLREKKSYENPLNRLYCDFIFFYPLNGKERVPNFEESPADIKAAEKLAKLHDELRVYNEFSSKSELHDLNIFIARLLFCFFAEDTGIFENNLFTSSIIRYTNNGSDLADYLDAAFNIMDVRSRNEDTQAIVSQFPYVNGGLFSKHIQIPKMSFRSRKIIIECGELDWKNINPDIFGSMIQAVVNPEERATKGMHYTSVPNIMKVISPLFLDDLQSTFNNLREQYDQKKRQLEIGSISESQFNKETKVIHRDCEKLLARMSKMKFFDPACGSGNFLIITYKSLRMLEMDILRLMRQIVPEIVFYDSSVIQLKQFYGIELLDFPHEVTMLSLWLAEHQMNRKFHDDFGVNTQALPLHTITQIVCANACRIDWNEVCRHEADEEVFVFGNPPYLGRSLREKEQQDDMDVVFENNLPLYKDLDYVACWFYKASKYILNTQSDAAFVTTNSICQGVQVSLLWPYILQDNNQIFFATDPFKWSNNAKDNAMVACVVVGITAHERPKYLFNNGLKIEVSNISPYLNSRPSTIVHPINTCVQNVPHMVLGSAPKDGGGFIFTESEYKDFCNKYPSFAKFAFPYIGADEFINGEMRYVLHIEDKDLEYALSCDEIKRRLELCRNMRAKSKKIPTRRLADHPNWWGEDRVAYSDCIIIPRHTLETRDYIPMGYLKAGTIVSDSSFAVYDAELWLFGLLTSRMHMIWTKAVCGCLGEGIRYSVRLCYNAFPFPKLTPERKQQLSEAAEEVILTRADHPEMTLYDFYASDKMPDDLRKAHKVLDDLVDSCYPSFPFANDDARLECLYKLYEKMTSESVDTTKKTRKNGTAKK